jgi:hypothetical protein
MSLLFYSEDGGDIFLRNIVLSLELQSITTQMFVHFIVIALKPSNPVSAPLFSFFCPHISHNVLRLPMGLTIRQQALASKLNQTDHTLLSVEIRYWIISEAVEL